MNALAAKMRLAQRGVEDLSHTVRSRCNVTKAGFRLTWRADDFVVVCPPIKKPSARRCDGNDLHLHSSGGFRRVLALVKPVAAMGFTIWVKRPAKIGGTKIRHLCGFWATIFGHNFATIAVSICSAQKSLSLFIFRDGFGFSQTRRTSPPREANRSRRLDRVASDIFFSP